MQRIEEESRLVPTRCDGGLVLSEGCPNEMWEGRWLGAIRTRVRYPELPSCLGAATAARQLLSLERVGASLPGTGALLRFVFSVGGSPCEQLGQIAGSRPACSLLEAGSQRFKALCSAHSQPRSGVTEDALPTMPGASLNTDGCERS